MTCQICFQPNRKICFQTSRLSICQWCVSELCAAKLSPNQIASNLRLEFQNRRKKIIEIEINTLQKQKSPPPKIEPNEIRRINHFANNQVRKSEGMLTSLYRSLIDDRARTEQAQKIINAETAKLDGIHRNRLALHAVEQFEIDTKITRLQQELYDMEAYESAFQEYLVSILLPEPTKSKEARLLRAFYLGLLNAEHELLQRPDEKEYDIIKKTIRREDLHKCVCCSKTGLRAELHVHHIIPLSKFGTNNTVNLVTLCHSCHNKQHPDFKVTRNQPIYRSPRKRRFVAVDIKTTGSSDEDSIIEIAAFLFVDGALDDFYYSSVYTKRKIPLAVVSSTGITNEANQRAPKADIVFNEFKKFIGNYCLVFHDAPFVMRFLNRYADYFGIPITNKVHDTLSIASQKLPNLANHKLSTLAKYFEIEVSKSHRAIYDSIATGIIYNHLSTLKKPRVKAKTKTKKSSLG